MHFHALSDRSISHFSRINSEIRNSKLSFRWHELFYYSTRIVPFHFHLFIYLLIFQYFLIALRNENNQNPKRSFRSHNRHYFYTNRMEIVDEKGGEKKKEKMKESFRRSRLVPQRRTRIIWLPIETIQRDMNISIHIWVISFCLITSLNSLSGGLHVKITKITSTCSQIDNSSSCSIKNKNNNYTYMHIRVCDVLFPLDTIFIAEKKMIFMTRTMLSFDKILPIKRPRVK